MANNNQATFNLGIKTTADLSGVEQLKKELEQIKKLSLDSNFSAGLDPKAINDMRKSAQMLENALNSAYDPKINLVNIDKFNSILSKSGLSIKTLQANLATAGDVGQKAFLTMATNLMKVNTVMKESNTFIEKLGKTFFNSLRYQVMNQAIQSMSGALSQAVGYTKSLDRSLNDIQIVSEKNSDSMKEFAKQANNAAKSLGASTTEYTDASLIYYQQGLSDEEVAGRTNTTMKMANVLGESASQVSDYMTAIWNNFDDGTKSLEYYGDAIAALGANTASSAAEIAEGLGKFSAVADTVGLSYEYATAALATVVAETRQSADTVGTAFKTLFARIEGLKLGDTLEDGTDLNKYSKALLSVGVNIKDANGELKSMDDLLDELGSKWGTLAKDQQVALAQTVAGTRQYNQLVALMDNWDEVRKNIDVAAESTGTLEKKNAIYMDSVEAHLQVMKTQWEDFYDSMLDTNTIKTFADSMTGIAKFATNFADSIGGVVPTLTAITSSLLKINTISSQISQSIATNIINVKNSFSSTKMIQENVQAIKQMFGPNQVWTDSNGNESQAMNMVLQQMGEQYGKIVDLQKVMTEEDKEFFQGLLNDEKELGVMAVKAEELISSFNFNQSNKSFANSSIGGYGLFKDLKDIKNFTDDSGLNNLQKRIDDITISFADCKVASQEFLLSLQSNAPAKIGYDFKFRLLPEINSFLEKAKQSGVDVDVLIKQLEKTGAVSKNVAGGLDYINGSTKESKQAVNNIIVELDKYIKKQQEMVTSSKNAKSGIDNLKNSFEGFSETLNLTAAINNIIQLTSSLGQVASAMLALKNIGNIFDKNNNLSDSEKFLQLIQNIGFQLPMLMSAFTSLNNVLKITQTFQAKRAIDSKAELITISKTIFYKSEEAQARAFANKQQEISILQTKLEIAKKTKENFLKKASILGLSEETKARWLDDAAQQDQIIKTTELTIKSKQEESERIKQIAFLKEEEKSRIAVTAASNTYLIIITAIIAAIAVLISLYDKKLEKEAEEAEILEKSYQEKLITYKEETKTIEELCDKLDELQSKYDSTQLSAYRNEVYQLCLQYEEEEKAIKALSSSFQDLNNIQNDLLIDQYNKEIDETKIAINKNIDAVIKDSKSRNTTPISILSGGMDTISLGTHSRINGDITSIKENLNDYLGLELREANVITPGSHDQIRDYVTSENLVESLIDNGKEEFIKSLEVLINSSDGSEKTFYESLLREVNSIISSDSYKNYEENFYRRQELQKNIITLNNKKDIDSQTTFDNAIANMVSEANTAGIFKEEDKQSQLAARQWARQALVAINSEWSDFAKNSGLADNLVGTIFGNDPEQIAEKLSTYGEAEISTIAGLVKYLQVASKDTNNVLEQTGNFFEALPRLTDYLEHEQYKITIQAALEEASTGQPLNKETIQKLFDEGFTYEGGQEEFSRLNTGTQQYLLIEEKLKQAESYGSVENAKREVGKLREDYINDEENQATIILGELSKNKLDEAYEATQNSENIKTEDKLVLTPEYFEELAIAVSDADEQDKILDADKKDLIKTLADEGIITEDALKLYGDRLKAEQKYDEGLKELTETYNNIQESSANYQEASDQLFASLEKVHKEIDRIQNAYKTVSSAIEEYSSQGYYSIDTTQGLIDLGPQYLQYLVDENANLSLSTDRLQDAARGEIELAKATWENAGAKQMLAIQESILNNEDITLFLNTYALTQAELDSADAALESAYNSAINAASKYDEANGTTAATDALTNYYNTIKAGAKLYDSSALNLPESLGSGSNSSSSKSKKELKELDDLYDRYYVLKKAIEDVEDAMSDLDKLQKHLSGKNLITALEKQNKLLAEQKVRYEDLIKEQQKEGGELKDILGYYGTTFSGNDISNYGEITSKMLNDYNNAVTQYNSGKLSDSAFQTAEDNYNKFKESLERYKSLLTEYEDSYNKLDDIYYKTLENNLQAWELTVELQLDTEQMTRDWNEFIHNLDTNIKLRFQDTDSIFDFNNSQLDSFGNTKAIQESAIDELIREIYNFAEDENYKSDKFADITEAQAKLKEYKESWMDTVNSIRDIQEETYEAYLQSIDDEVEKIEEVNKAYEKLADRMEHISKLNELLYGDEEYDNNNQILNEQSQIYLSQLQQYSEQVSTFGELYEQAIEEGDEKAALKYYEAREDALKSLYSTEEEYVEKLNEIRENSANKMLDAFYRNLYGMNEEDTERQWDRVKYVNDGRYDETQRAYQLQTFRNKSQQVVDKANIKMQAKIKAAVESINKGLAERNELTEYDVELAEKKLKVLEAEAALEDARNNKNSMKLTRDASGNWSYQYVADEDDVKDKEQALLDASSDMYDFTKNHNEDLTEQINNYMTQYAKRVQELTKKGQWNAEEERKLNEEYFGEDGYVTVLRERMYISQQDLAEATTQMALTQYQVDQNAYTLMTEEKKRLINELTQANINSFAEIESTDGIVKDNMLAKAKEVNEQEIDYINTQKGAAADALVNDPDSIQNTFMNMVETAMQIQGIWEQSVEDGCIAAKESFIDVGTGVEIVDEKLKQLDEDTNDVMERAAELLSIYVSRLHDLEGAYNSLVGNVKNYGAAIDEALRKQAQLANSQQSSVFNGSGSFSGLTNNPEGDGPGDPKVPPKEEYIGWRLHKIYGDGSDEQLGGKDKGAKQPFASESELVEAYNKMNNIDKANWRKERLKKGEFEYKAFATGGYTGDWNDGSGKLAMLHSKELVLNAEDTKNMLETVNVVRGLASIGNSISDAIATSVAGMIASIAGTSFVGGSTSTSASNNTFNITAEFPNANDVNEIREAILSLPNLASQYLSQKDL